MRHFSKKNAYTTSFSPIKRSSSICPIEIHMFTTHRSSDTVNAFSLEHLLGPHGRKTKVGVMSSHRDPVARSWFRLQAQRSLLIHTEPLHVELQANILAKKVSVFLGE